MHAQQRRHTQAWAFGTILLMDMLADMHSTNPPQTVNNMQASAIFLSDSQPMNCRAGV